MSALYPDWARAAAATVAQLRTAVGADPDDPALAALVAELSDAGPEFAELWRRHDVRRRHTDRKTFRHPDAGEITFLYESLDVGPEGQRPAIYQTVPGTPDHEKMRLLSLASG
ncbi:hypothetical protein ABZ806_24615 [Spirillospora sp. NPDC047418]